ncbi:hypothetical protein HII31_06016 [Pseudocercospora fuligena]|uniref:Nucleoside phosphorylase domain-containing protein n=1 Tax=Pseudocercospora fuligena TaxID=685502 RepID=A0A8H6VJF4_9PEZI|nr:hypothetical protein HII31_06016 [Pseudocercospora fuligena]
MGYTHSERDGYRVGVICALPRERTAVEAVLDERHGQLPNVEGDSNTYTYGRIGLHKVVIASLSAGDYGTVPAGGVASDMRRSFKAIKYTFMVGIAGAAPSLASRDGDVRLGDVVVGCAAGAPSIVSYRTGKATTDKNAFDIRSELAEPPAALRRAVAALQTAHQVDGPTYLIHLQHMLQSHPRLNKERIEEDYYNVPSAADTLYRTHIVHPPSAHNCDVCKNTAHSIVKRATRHLRDPPDLLHDLDRIKFITKSEDDTFDYPKVHYGTIASSDVLMKDAVQRDHACQQILAQKKAHVLCFEMEAAGLPRDLPCLVIRGLCDYCDSHKNDTWQNFAAAAAAAVTKDLLLKVDAEVVEQATPAHQTVGDRSESTVTTIRDTIANGIPVCMSAFASIDSMITKPADMTSLSSDLKNLYGLLGTIEHCLNDADFVQAMNNPRVSANLHDLTRNCLDIAQIIGSTIREYVAISTNPVNPDVDGLRGKEETLLRLREELRDHKLSLDTAIGVVNLIRNESIARASLRMEQQLQDVRAQLTALAQRITNREQTGLEQPSQQRQRSMQRSQVEHLRKGHQLLVALSIKTDMPTTHFSIQYNGKRVRESEELDKFPPNSSFQGLIHDSASAPLRAHLVAALLKNVERGTNALSTATADVTRPASDTHGTAADQTSVPGSFDDLRKRVEHALGSDMEHELLQRLLQKIIYARRIGYVLEDLDDPTFAVQLSASVPALSLRPEDIKGHLLTELELASSATSYLELDIASSDLPKPPLKYHNWTAAMSQALDSPLSDASSNAWVEVSPPAETSLPAPDLAAPRVQFIPVVAIHPPNLSDAWSETDSEPPDYDLKSAPLMPPEEKQEISLTRHEYRRTVGTGVDEYAPAEETSWYLRMLSTDTREEELEFFLMLRGPLRWPSLERYKSRLRKMCHPFTFFRPPSLANGKPNRFGYYYKGMWWRDPHKFYTYS